MPDSFAILDDRAVLRIDGPDARDLLQRLVTNDVETLSAGEARYAALLTPQGKIVTDFLLVADPGGGFWLEGPAANAADLAKKLNLYKLRAKVTVTDRPDLAVVASAEAPPGSALIAYADPRGTVWSRAIAARAGLPATGAAALAAYHAQRIRAGVPQGGIDFAYGETFPHEANLDHLNGVDFRKGCYVGQEVVSRVQHRGTARKRIVALAFTGEAPPPGAEILAEGTAIGTIGSSIPGLALGLVRLDRAADASGPITAAGVTLHVRLPAWAVAART